MDENHGNQAFDHEILDAAFHSPIAALDIPKYIIAILEQGGFHNVGELIQQIDTDREKILEISGIGSKILEQIEVAITNFEPEISAAPMAYHPPPVPTLADFYKPPLGAKPDTQKEDNDDDESSETISYNAPVPSLADYFDPDNMVVVVESVPLAEFKKQAESKKKTAKKTPKKSDKKSKEKTKKTKSKKEKKKGKKVSKKKKTNKKKTAKTKEKKKSKKKPGYLLKK